MEQIKRVKRVAHLYERRYQTAAGEWRSKYYGIFTCKLKRKRRVFPLGGDLNVAKEALALLLAENVNGKDFDAAIEPERKGYTFTEWVEEYFAKKIDPQKHALGVKREKQSYGILKPFFGNMLLSDIKRSVIMEYRARRLQDVIAVRGKPIKFGGEFRTVSFPTVNRELAFLRSMLNMAEHDEIIEAAPKFKSKGKNNLIKSEKDRRRTRVIMPEEYAAILSHMRRPQQRVLIAWYETAMRHHEPFKLTWDMVDFKKGLLRLPLMDGIKEKCPRRTPISWELQQVLEELLAEQRRVPNVGKFVFTRKNGRPVRDVRTAFDLAKAKALEGGQIENDDIVPHDFRRASITRWTSAGISRDMVEVCSGHKPNGVHDGYINFSDEQLTDAFRELMLPPNERKNHSTPVIQAKPLEHARVVSY
jgi:integrase